MVDKSQKHDYLEFGSDKSIRNQIKDGKSSTKIIYQYINVKN